VALPKTRRGVSELGVPPSVAVVPEPVPDACPASCSVDDPEPLPEFAPEEVPVPLELEQLATSPAAANNVTTPTSMCFMAMTPSTRE